MKLKAGTTANFVFDATRNRIVRQLESAFVAHFRYRPSPGEVRSWEESLARLGLVVSGAGLKITEAAGSELHDAGADGAGEYDVLVRGGGNQNSGSGP